MQIFTFRGRGRFAKNISDPFLKIGRSQNITAHTSFLISEGLNFLYIQAEGENLKGQVAASSWLGAKYVLGEMQGKFDLNLRFLDCSMQ